MVQSRLCIIISRSYLMRKKIIFLLITILTLFFVIYLSWQSIYSKPPFIHEDIQLIPEGELMLWLDANALESELDSDTLLKIWSDQSGNGHDAMAYNYPQLVKQELNDKHAIRFNGENSFLKVDLDIKDDLSVFIVFANRTSDLNQQGLQFLMTTNTDKKNVSITAKQPEFKQHDYPQWHVSGALGSSFINGRHTDEIGPDFYQHRFIIGSALLEDISFSNELFLAASNDLTDYGQHDIAEIILYNRRLNTDEHAQVLDYLGQKYDIAVQTLPPDHPVETFNYILGTQQIGSFYSFGSDTKIVNAAHVKLKAGSRIFKSILSPRYVEQLGVSRRSDINSLTELVKNEPSINKIFNMPFTDYLFWVYPFNAEGVGVWEASEAARQADQQREYKEIYELTTYLLNTYKETGKTFYLGNWEGDWHLFQMDRNRVPSSQRIQGMLEWANNRQKAIDDAKAAYIEKNGQLENVNVYYYVEVNFGVQAANSNTSVAYNVIPHLDKLDFISWSAYDVRGGSQQEVNRVMSYLNSILKPDSSILGSRIIIGEYGNRRGRDSAVDQTRKIRDFGLSFLNSNVTPRFVLSWQVYNNEYTNPEDRQQGRANPETSAHLSLIDELNRIEPMNDLYVSYFQEAKKFVYDFYLQYERLPTENEFLPHGISILRNIEIKDNRFLDGFSFNPSGQLLFSDEFVSRGRHIPHPYLVSRDTNWTSMRSVIEEKSFDGYLERLTKMNNNKASLIYSIENLKPYINTLSQLLLTLYAYQDTESVIRIYTSKDGLNWSELKLSTEKTPTFKGWYRVYLSVHATLPEGSTYIKIEIDNTKEPNHLQLTKLDVYTSDPIEKLSLKSIIDNLEVWDASYYTEQSWIQFQKMLKNAQKVLYEQHATISQVTHNREQLLSSYHNLQDRKSVV